MSKILYAYDTKETILRHDLEAICGDIVEALILDLFISQRIDVYNCEGDTGPPWFHASANDVHKALGLTSISVSTVGRKLRSLVDKNLLEMESCPWHIVPRAKRYAINPTALAESHRQIRLAS